MNELLTKLFPWWLLLPTPDKAALREIELRARAREHALYIAMVEEELARLKKKKKAK